MSLFEKWVEIVDIDKKMRIIEYIVSTYVANDEKEPFAVKILMMIYETQLNISDGRSWKIKLAILNTFALCEAAAVLPYVLVSLHDELEDIRKLAQQILFNNGLEQPMSARLIEKTTEMVREYVSLQNHKFDFRLL